MRRKVSLSRRGDTAELMACMPNISTAKPMRMSPMWFWAGFLQNMRRMMPITAMTPVMVAVDSSSIQPEPPPM